MAGGPERPLVSVIVPCYNQARFLGEAVESALSQGYPCLEVIVVDDGATDDTAVVAARYPAVRYLWQPNQGLSAARNAGWRVSKGEYLAFLDADDRLLPDAIEAGVQQLILHPDAAFTFGRHLKIDADGRPLPAPRQPLVIERHYETLLRMNYISMPAKVMYRRNALDAVQGFARGLDAAADYDLYLRLARRFPVVAHTRVVAEYRQHGSNMSGNAAVMLRTTSAILRARRRAHRGDARFTRACRDGRRYFAEYYGTRLLSALKAALREWRWRDAARHALALAPHADWLAGHAGRRLWSRIG
jgi:glycosyltransferase involved in cell wall biosynthesis